MKAPSDPNHIIVWNANRLTGELLLRRVQLAAPGTTVELVERKRPLR